MRLISDWRNCWRYYSVQALVAIAALPAIWASLPYEAQMMLPEAWRPWLFSALAVSGVIGRVVSQRD